MNALVMLAAGGLVLFQGPATVCGGFCVEGRHVMTADHCREALRGITFAGSSLLDKPFYSSPSADWGALPVTCQPAGTISKDCGTALFIELDTGRHALQAAPKCKAKCGRKDGKCSAHLSCLAYDGQAGVIATGNSGRPIVDEHGGLCGILSFADRLLPSDREILSYEPVSTMRDLKCEDSTCTLPPGWPPLDRWTLSPPTLPVKPRRPSQ